MIKTLLYNYPRYVRAIDNIKQQILVTTGERTYPNMISNYSHERQDYNTNEYHSTTETHAIRNIESQIKAISDLYIELKALEQVVQAIKLSLEDLREQESRIIELRYFKKYPWSKVAEEAFISEAHAKLLNSMILADLNKELKYIRLI